MVEKNRLSRRKFLVRGGLGVAGVLAVGTYVLRNPIRRSILEIANTVEQPYIGEINDPTVWFEILKDNSVLLHSPKVEMGQGSFTSFAQIAADELEIPMEMLHVVHAASSTGNIDGVSTGGSTSVSSLWQPLRELAATMREMIRIKGAEKLGVAVNEITISNGSISANGKFMTYAEVAKEVTDWPEIDTPALKPLNEYQFVGKPIPRIDLNDKVYGNPILVWMPK